MKSRLTLLIGLGLLAPVSIANAIPPGPCVHGEVSSNSGVILVCPKGDGPSLASKGLTISVRILDGYGNPIANWPKKDIGLVAEGMYACPTAFAGTILVADAATDADGRTTISGVPKGGGCENGGGVYVAVRDNGAVLYLGDAGGTDCNVITVPITIRSPDLNGDGTVSLSDYSQFVAIYQNGPYNECADFNGDGVISLPDFSMFTTHYQPGHPDHSCQ